MSIYNDNIKRVYNLSQSEKAHMCSKWLNELFYYWKNRYGENKAYDLIVSTVCIVASNDGKIKFSELDLYNYCIASSCKMSYDQFFNLCSRLQTQSNRQYWENEAKSINDMEIFQSFLLVMMAVATFDGDINAREEALISSFCDFYVYKFSR